jgi:hypothetical protein
MATTNYNLPTITGNMNADVVRDMNALAEATDTAIKQAVGSVDLSVVEGEIADVSNDLTAHLADGVKHITSAERTTWNGKSNFSGSYTDLTNKPTIPTLNNTVTSTSTTQAATANAVKTAYDKAASAENTANSAGKLASGSYVGNSASGTRFINVGFTPSLSFVYEKGTHMGQYFISMGNNAEAITSVFKYQSTPENRKGGGNEIGNVTDGIQVHNSPFYFNQSGKNYGWVALA